MCVCVRVACVCVCMCVYVCVCLEGGGGGASAFLLLFSIANLSYSQENRSASRDFTTKLGVTRKWSAVVNGCRFESLPCCVPNAPGFLENKQSFTSGVVHCWQ